MSKYFYLAFWFSQYVRTTFKKINLPNIISDSGKRKDSSKARIKKKRVNPLPSKVIYKKTKYVS